MRVSVFQDESGALDWQWFNAQRKTADVYLNGALVGEVRTADEEAGFVERIRRDASGEIVLNQSGDGPEVDRLEGVVKIVVRDIDA